MESKDKSNRNLAKHTHEMLVEMSHRDSLTGLLNRRGYQEQFELFFKHAQRSGEKLQIIILDVNNFRQVNKRYEHSGGDEALKKESEEDLFNRVDKLMMSQKENE